MNKQKKSSSGKLKSNKLGGYKIEKLIGAGAYGQVHLVTDENNVLYVAKTEINEGDVTLLYEAFIFKKLSKAGNNLVPKFKELIVQKDMIIIITEYRGYSLYDYIQKTHLGPDVVARIFVQGMAILKEFMKAGVIHCDIKSQNIVVDSQTNQILFIDFGLAICIKDIHGNIKRQPNTRFAGTINYAPISAHTFTPFSFKDDVESLCYMLIQLINGRLPWQGIVIDSQSDRIVQVGETKKSLMKDSETIFNSLCAGLENYSYIPRTLARIISSDNAFENEADYDRAIKEAV